MGTRPFKTAKQRSKGFGAGTLPNMEKKGNRCYTTRGPMGGIDQGGGEGGGERGIFWSAAKREGGKP